ncbi:MAG: hypothetical protein PHO41_10910 [Eubacteriales bacterium]|nr:hypothetical protein [Eubacteriales bacterium]
MAKYTLDVPAAAGPLVIDALSLWAQGQGKSDGTKAERAQWALRHFVGQAVRQYRVIAAQTAQEAAYQQAQEAAVIEGDQVEGSISIT